MRKAPFFLLCVILIAFSLFVLIFFKNYNQKSVQTQNDIYLELWHVDTFEGGIGSRKSFLQNCANRFNKNANVKVIVKEQTLYSCKQNFEKGIYPDLISYGNGLDIPFGQLCEINKQGENKYATVWCMGGYVLIERVNQKTDGIILSVQENTVSSLAYGMANLQLSIYEEIESKNAIYAFYQNKNKALLGTQRDLYRLLNKGIEIKTTCLTAYNDLYQYISVLSTNGERANYSILFIDFLTSQKIQLELNKIGMFSFKYGVSLEQNSPLEVYKNCSFEYVTPCLITAEQIQNLKNKAKNYNENVQNIKNALKRLK